MEDTNPKSMPHVTPSTNNLTAQPPSSGRKIRYLSATFLLLASLSLGFLGGWLGSDSRGNFANTQNNRAQIVSTESELISGIADTVGDSVVSVNVTGQTEVRSIFGERGTQAQASAGTGAILSTNGYVITNRHVVPEGTTEVSVTLSDGTELTDVKVVGRTAATDTLDIAFLKIGDTKGKKLVAAKVGDSAKVEVGEKVIAIGNALGQFQNTVTSGIISGYGRSVTAGDGEFGGDSETLQNLFQTDAAINQGNSGGPLVNVNGEVIGINTAIAGGDAQNIGFAIPINDTQGLIKSVLKNGKFERPFLGVRYVTLTDDYAFQFNLSTKRGAYVAPSDNGQSSIVPDSPAAKAGIREKDIITKIEGSVIDERNSLVSLIGQRSVGDKVQLTVIRDGKTQTIEVTLQAAPRS